MKKTFAVLMLATMLFAVGCGNQAQEAAKDAQQKVEQTANEAKDAASKAADNAAAKVDEAKKEAASEVQEAASKVEQKAAEVAGNTPATAKTDSKISIGGIYPGMSFDEAKKILGEPVTSDDDEFIFANGLKLDVESGIVEEIKTTTSGVKTAQGVEVGMMEYAIDEFCGAADKVETDDDGEVEYKYYSGDKKSEVVYTVRNDLITEIKLGTRD